VPAYAPGGLLLYSLNVAIEKRCGLCLGMVDICTRNSSMTGCGAKLSVLGINAFTGQVKKHRCKPLHVELISYVAGNWGGKSQVGYFSSSLKTLYS